MPPPRLTSRDVPIFARVIGALEFLGGVQGVWIAAPAIVAVEGFSPVAAMLAAVYVASVVAGVGAFRWTRRGRTLSLVVQAVQLLAITSTSFSFSFVSGAGLWLGVGRGGVATQRVLGSAFEWHTQSGFGPGINQIPFSIAINVIGAAAFVWLLLHAPAAAAHVDHAEAAAVDTPSDASSVISQASPAPFRR